MPLDADLPFTDRRGAGRALAESLRPWSRNAVILGVPRGGIVVADEVASVLGLPLDIVVAKKMGAPGQPELALGAVTADGTAFFNDELIRMLGVPQSWLDGVLAEQSRAAQLRERFLRGVLPPVSLEGRTAIVVDDGFATGATIRAAVRAVRRRHPARVIAAAPVGSSEACAGLRIDADDVVCLRELADFGAVGLYYLNFEPVEDEAVRTLLAGRATPGAAQAVAGAVR